MLTQLLFMRRFLKAIALFTMIAFIVTACDDEKEASQPQPTVSSLSISEGEVGTNVTITGTNFGTTTADVSIFFNTKETSPESVTNTTISVAVPAGATTGIVTVKVKSLEASGPSFTVLAPITVSVTNFNGSISENQRAGNVIGTVLANTNRGSLTYSITSQSVNNAVAILPTGQLVVADASAYDFEVNPTITGVVSVANGSETATANISITVTDFQEVIVENFIASLAENPSAFTSIGYVVANGVGSNDEGAGPVTTLVSQSLAGAITFNGNEIQVANATLFDFETNPTITGTYSVRYLSETRTASITISLTDVDEGQTDVTVNLVAGSGSQVGCTTGTGSAILFNSVFFGEASADEGGVYVTLADLNCGIRRVYIPNSGSATSTSLNGSISQSILVDVVYGSSYSLASFYNSSTGAGNILKIPTNGDPATNLLATNAVFMPTGITTDASGNIYVAETDGRKIKVFNSTGTFLGSYGTGAVGGADGLGNTATFARTRDVQIDASGNLYVADRSSVRKIDTDGNITTVAGANNLNGDAIGNASVARFNEIHAIGLMPNGKIIVADHGNGKIKLIDTNGTVTTLVDDGYVPNGIMVQDNNTFFFTTGSALYKVTLSTGCVGCR